MKKVYFAGSLAHYDAHYHIVPCKVLDVIEQGNGRNVTLGKLRIRVTKQTGPYRSQEILEVPAFHVIPRGHLRRRKYSLAIDVNYEWSRDHNHEQVVCKLSCLSN